MPCICMLLTLMMFSGSAEVDQPPKACCSAEKAPVQAEKVPDSVQAETTELAIPDIAVRDEEGRARQLYSDLMENQLVAVSFIFTTCTTICPPIGANFAKLEQELARRTGDPVRLISISVDPNTDTPQRLKAWKARFGGGSGWTLVTGSKLEIDKALRAMQFFTADKTDHSPFLLLGNARTGSWRRVNGFTDPKALADLLAELANEKAAPEKAALIPSQSHHQPVLASTTAAAAPVMDQAQEQVQVQEQSPAHRYFTDVALIDQDGKSRKLYTDLMDGKIVVMQSFFTACTGVCPKTVAGFAKMQEHLGDRLGKEVYLLSISVDPANDTPQRLKAYADEVKARPGWFFLTGVPEDVQMALHKFGQKVDAPEGHSNIFIMGNTRTGLWKKAQGMSDDAGLIGVLDSVLLDQGSEPVLNAN